MASALLISQNNHTCNTIRAVLPAECNIEQVNDPAKAMYMAQNNSYDIVFIDIQDILEHWNPDDKTRRQPLAEIYNGARLVVITPQDRIPLAVAAVRAGAIAYLTAPITKAAVRLLLDRLSETAIQQSELDYLRNQFWGMDTGELVETRNAEIKAVFRKIASVAPTRTTVLIVGETGTGKGILARRIHQLSNRRNAQLISVHCGAIPDTLLESELFGHEKGAFTGATRRKPGKFELARNGTIFLDEVGTITSSAQIKLLEVLQDGTFSRLGGEESFVSNARIIAATNANLRQMSEDGEFRKDLYYRLNVFPIEVPPLRKRTEDIPLFVQYFLQRLDREYQKGIAGVHPSILTALETYNWPGNIRELENIVERAYILETSSTLTPESFPSELIEKAGSTAIMPLDSSRNLADSRRRAVEAFERQYLKDLLERNRGIIKKAADEAGVSTRQLHKLMKKHCISKEDFKNRIGGA
jgi:DNA-binding NtrC family response regulator